jgi:uncharacterized membrane protein YphA (DoxX/SURF4 family)
VVGVLEVAGAVGLLIPLLSSLAALRLAAVTVGAAMTPPSSFWRRARGCPWPSW